MTFAYLKTVENIGKSGEIEDLGFLGKFQGDKQTSSGKISLFTTDK